MIPIYIILFISDHFLSIVSLHHQKTFKKNKRILSAFLLLYSNQNELIS